MSRNIFGKNNTST